MKFVIFLPALFYVISAECPGNVPGMPEFEVDKFVGVWILQAFTEDDKPVHHCQADIISADGKQGEGSGTVISSWVRDGHHSANTMHFKLDETPGSFKTYYNDTVILSESTVVESDYSRYVIVYSCIREGQDKTRPVMYLFSRQSERLPEEVLNQFSTLAEEFGLGSEFIGHVQFVPDVCF